MNLPVTKALVFLGLLSPAVAASCQNAPGVANGECVTFYSQAGCDSAMQEGKYKPTCEGNCFQYPFASILVAGDGTYGTNCYAYSDSNCQNYIGQTGNKVVGTASCHDFGGSNSMKCYYRC